MKLFVCLLVNWLCVVIRRHEPKSPLTLSEKIKTVVEYVKIDGGRVLMAITNTLMMVQAGSPTGVCVVRSRESNHGQG
mgnify:CR=1 FL=1